MTPDALRDFCLALPQAVEEFPFDDVTSVFKTSGNNKIFALSSLGSEPLAVSLKIDPEDSLALQAEFAAVTPGYHLNKKHWVTIVLGPSTPSTPSTPTENASMDALPDDLVEQLIRDSHSLVRPKVPRAR